MEYCETVAYAEDLTLIVRAGSREGFVEKAIIALDRIAIWMEINYLTLAGQKTEAVIFKGPRKREGIGFTLGGNEVLSTKSARHLGIYIGNKLIFNKHVKKSI